MINVIRKNNTIDSPATISTRNIISMDTGDSILLTDPVKDLIEVSYDALGYPDKQSVVFGVQFDHRVTWIRFNLDKLVWNLGQHKGVAFAELYKLYTFKVAIARVGDTGPAQMWEFDGYDFEIPRGVTKVSGTYRLILIIEEWQRDEHLGNIKEDTAVCVERFVAAELKGKVHSTFYDPTQDIIVDDETVTDQLDSLIKPTILCTLADNGEFSADTKELGQKFDNYIRYFKFNPRRITAHLNDFRTFAIFQQGDQFFYSQFERTNEQDPLDDYTESHPIIAWIPSGVYKTAGTWQVAIISFAGKLDDINNLEDNGDYYFFVSKTVRMMVAKNYLTQDDIYADPTLAITSNLITEIGEIIITKDNQVFNAKPSDPQTVFNSDGSIFFTNNEN